MGNLSYSVSGTFAISGEAEGMKQEELEEALMKDLRENLTSFQIDEIEIEEME